MSSGGSEEEQLKLWFLLLFTFFVPTSKQDLSLLLDFTPLSLVLCSCDRSYEAADLAPHELNETYIVLRVAAFRQLSCSGASVDLNTATALLLCVCNLIKR